MLTIDIGNSTIASALFYKDLYDPEPLERLPTGAMLEADECGAALRRFLEGRDIDAVIISSVVPCLTKPFLKMLKELGCEKPLLVNSALYPLLPVKIPGPRAPQIGTDIVCNAVEAYARFQGPCVIVDFGTALTFTALGASGDLLGTAIAPGLATAAQSLAGNAAQLYLVPIEEPPSPLGANTVQAIQSGLVFGWVGLAESLVNRFKTEICRKEGISRERIQVIATGGFCGLIAPLTGIFDHVDRLLVLHGLRRIAHLVFLP